MAFAVEAFGEGPEANFQHARVSYETGGGMVKGKDDADWSYVSVNTLILPGDNLWIDKEGTLELEMYGATYFRMADGSKAEVVSAPPDGRMRAWTGVFYAQRSARSQGEFLVESPVCAVKVDADSQVRLDVISNGATTVTVRWGRALVAVEGGQPVALQTGERSFVDPGYLPSPPQKFDRSEEDAFDSWNRERVRLLAIGTDAIPRAIRIENPPVGIADLSPYGEWVSIDSDYCWRPTAVADFIPYRNGHWSFVPGCGYVWVDDYPFCYVTSHYGRWRHHDRYGWVWSYRDGWGPAWVATVHYGSNFVWCPLDPFDRPVSFGAEFFTVGGLRFGVSMSTYCAAGDLLAGPCRVRPCTPLIVRNVPPAEINIWNIRVNNFGPGRGGPSGSGFHSRGIVPYTDSTLQVRDFSPQRVIRGWESRDHNGHESARVRALGLESREGRTEFATFKSSPERRIAPPEPGRTTFTAKPRSAHVSASALEEVRQRTTQVVSSPAAGRSPELSKNLPNFKPQESVAPRRSIHFGEGGPGSSGKPHVSGPPDGGVVGRSSRDERMRGGGMTGGPTTTVPESTPAGKLPGNIQPPQSPSGIPSGGPFTRGAGSDSKGPGRGEGNREPGRKPTVTPSTPTPVPAITADPVSPSKRFGDFSSNPNAPKGFPSMDNVPSSIRLKQWGTATERSRSIGPADSGSPVPQSNSPERKSRSPIPVTPSPSPSPVPAQIDRTPPSQPSFSTPTRRRDDSSDAPRKSERTFSVPQVPSVQAPQVSPFRGGSSEFRMPKHVERSNVPQFSGRSRENSAPSQPQTAAPTPAPRFVPTAPSVSNPNPRFGGGGGGGSGGGGNSGGRSENPRFKKDRD